MKRLTVLFYVITIWGCSDSKEFYDDISLSNFPIDNFISLETESAIISFSKTDLLRLTESESHIKDNKEFWKTFNNYLDSVNGNQNIKLDESYSQLKDTITRRLIADEDELDTLTELKLDMDTIRLIDNPNDPMYRVKNALKWSTSILLAKGKGTVLRKSSNTRVSSIRRKRVVFGTSQSTSYVFDDGEEVIFVGLLLGL